MRRVNLSLMPVDEEAPVRGGKDDERQGGEPYRTAEGAVRRARPAHRGSRLLGGRDHDAAGLDRSLPVAEGDARVVAARNVQEPLGDERLTARRLQELLVAIPGDGDWIRRIHRDLRGEV